MDGRYFRVIARIHTDFPTKFGIPRQSGLVPGLKAEIVFEPEYRNPDALRGIEEFSNLWLIWEFSGAVREQWSPTVRPPRLGGNTRMGVFATRSPFRPNPVGLSSVGSPSPALSRILLQICRNISRSGYSSNMRLPSYSILSHSSSTSSCTFLISSGYISFMRSKSL